MKKKAGTLRKIIIEHIINNKKEYITITLMFIIGIFLGVFFINNINENQAQEITNYFSSSIEGLKNTQNIQYMTMLKNSIIQNTLLVIVLWFLGTTIIGIPIVIMIIAYNQNIINKKIY